MQEILKQIKTTILLYVSLTLLTGMLYPALITLVAKQLFPWEANGSLLVDHDVILGSSLIGQFSDSSKYFWSRPSATLPYPYHGASSSGSNFGPSNPTYLQQVQTRIDRVFKTKRDEKKLVPADLVTASASGLDPDISPYAAYYQVQRIAAARHIAPEIITNMVIMHIQERKFGIFGEPRVNVLQLNLALDKLRKTHGRAPTQSR